MEPGMGTPSWRQRIINRLSMGPAQDSQANPVSEAEGEGEAASGNEAEVDMSKSEVADEAHSSEDEDNDREPTPGASEPDEAWNKEEEEEVDQESVEGNIGSLNLLSPSQANEEHFESDQEAISFMEMPSHLPPRMT
ncbi:unnamed protein product, partial [Chrysoparadoxa australica]